VRRTGLTGVTCEDQCLTGLTGHHHRSDRWSTVSSSVWGEKVSFGRHAYSPPPLGDIKVLSVTRLEKIEGKRIINIFNDDIPQVDSQGVLHATTWQHRKLHLRFLCVCRWGFIRSNHHCQSRPRLDRPPGRSNRPIWPDGHDSRTAVAFVGCA
jgi:hypothetical protein